ncbi:MAG: Flp pilus assembly protein CpaB [Anaerolineaceae bacterium]
MAGGGRRRGFIFIILALVIIAGLVVVGFLFRNQISSAQLPQQAIVQQPAQQMVNIVITTQAIPRGTTLTEGVLTTIPYPEQDVVQGVFYTNVKDVVGKQVKFDLEPRVPLTVSMIASGALGSNAAFQIPRGMVAISIPISRLTAVSFAPTAGDHVNILVALLLTDVDQANQSRLPNLSAPVSPPTLGGEGVLPSITANIGAPPEGANMGRVELDTVLNQPIYIVPSEDQRPRMVSQTLIQDAIVLRMGNFEIEDTTQPAAAQPTPTPIVGGQAAPAPVVPDVITLVVRPQDAVTLNYLMLAGAKLNLVLRSAGDSDPIQTEAVTLQFLMQQYNIPDPSKLPFSLEPAIENMVYPKDDAAPATPVRTQTP